MSTIYLERSITVNRDGIDTDVASLDIATPTARHFVKFGSPFMWKSMDVNDARARPVFNEKAVSKFLGECTGVGEDAIGTLSAPDYLNARWTLLMDILSSGKTDGEPRPDVLKLVNPLVTHAGSITELKIATPSAKTIIQTGVPFEWRQDENDNAYVVYNDRLCMKYLSAMTGRDELELEDIIAGDWIAARNKVFSAMNSFVGSTANP